MQIRDAKDFWAGVMFAVVGLFFIVFAQENEIGRAARMGPAFFPTILGGLMMFLGLFVAILGLVNGTKSSLNKIAPFHWRFLFYILGSVFVFTMLLKPLGLMLSLAAMIVIALMSEKKLFFKETLALIVILDAFAWVTFVYGIGMIVPVWPTIF